MRRGMSLVEVLVAGAILLAALVPLLSLLTTSSAETVKARDRAAAMSLATAVVEEMRARRPLDRANLPPTTANALAQFRAILDAHKNDYPQYGAGLERTFENFTCSALVPAAGPMKVDVSWTEAGEPRRHELDAVSVNP